MTQPATIALSVATRRQLSQAVLWLIAGGAAVAFLYFVNPAGFPFLPACPLYTLTGLHCPGCGMTRATHALLHGQLLAALRFNVLFTVGLPVLAVAGLWCWLRGRVLPWSPAATWWTMGSLIAFGVARNIPAAPFCWLAP